jgi:hypothetical protein
MRWSLLKWTESEFSVFLLNCYRTNDYKIIITKLSVNKMGHPMHTITISLLRATVVHLPRACIRPPPRRLPSTSSVSCLTRCPPFLQAASPPLPAASPHRHTATHRQSPAAPPPPLNSYGRQRQILQQPLKL